MKRISPTISDDSNEDEIWEYKSLKREKTHTQSGSQICDNGNIPCRTQGQITGKTKRKSEIGHKKETNRNPAGSQQQHTKVDVKKEGSNVKKNHGKYPPKKEKTPSKSYRPDLELLQGYCPNCQVPYAALSMKSPTWHVNECLERNIPNSECPAGLNCDNTLPCHYWTFSHGQLARLRGSGHKMHDLTEHQRDQRTVSRVKLNLFDESQPCHSKKLVDRENTRNFTDSALNEYNGNTLSESRQTSSQRSPPNVRPTTESPRGKKIKEEIHPEITQTNSHHNEAEEESAKELDEMLANAYGCDSDHSSDTPADADSLVITKESFSIQLDSPVKCSSPSLPESPASMGSLSQGSLDSYIKVNRKLGRKSSQTTPIKQKTPIKTPSKPKPSSSKKSSNKKRKIDTDSISPIIISPSSEKKKRVSGSTGKKIGADNGNSLGETSPASTQPSVKSFFNKFNANKNLFQKSSTASSAEDDHDNSRTCTGYLQKIDPVSRLPVKEEGEKRIKAKLPQTSSVIDTYTPHVITIDDENMDKNVDDCDEMDQKNVTTNDKCNTDWDNSVTMETEISRSNTTTVGTCTSASTKETTNQTSVDVNKNVFSVLMDKEKPQRSRSETIVQGHSDGQGPVNALAILMKAKQWGKTRTTATVKEGNGHKSSTSAGAKPDEGIDLYVPDPEPTQWNGQRQCPFYKKMPGTTITVDAFSFGTIAGCTAYFLSHFHYDHYKGLGKKFSHPIYCTKITANLVARRLKVESRYLHPLPMATPTVVDQVEVTLLEANHCPGSVLFLFKLRDGRTYLHTGDFRACPAMELYPALSGIHVNQLYLDTTYCDPSYTFPPQKDVIDFAVSLVTRKLRENPKTLVVCGSYTIGKERIFTAIAKALKCKICVTREKKAILDCLEDTTLKDSVTLSQSEAKVHVLPMGKLNQKNLSDYLVSLKAYTEVLAFEPTGWTHSNKIISLEQLRPKYSRNGIHIYGVPYSEHSSYLEMKRFTQHLRPDKILPTVNNGNTRARKRMEALFKSWMDELKNKCQNPPTPKQSTLRSWTD